MEFGTSNAELEAALDMAEVDTAGHGAVALSIVEEDADLVEVALNIAEEDTADLAEVALNIVEEDIADLAEVAWNIVEEDMVVLVEAA